MPTKYHNKNCSCPFCKAKDGENYGANNNFYGMKHSKKTKLTIGEKNSKPKNESIPISSKQIEILNGMMLGDGHIDFNNVSGRYTQGCKYEEFLHHIRDVLPFDWSPIWHDMRWDCYHMKSHFTPTLLEFGKRWYQKKFKIVPESLNLTPSCILYWYLSDGCLCYSNRNKFLNSKYFQIVFSTDGFKKSDVVFISEKLKKIDINNVILKNKRIYIKSESKERLFEYMDACPVNCYNYKWGEKY